ncbi:MAG: serpin family protein, partial [Gemmatimonadota bacterium]
MSRLERKRVIPLSVFLVFLAAGCGGDSPFGLGPGLSGLPRTLSQEEALLIGAGNDFAFRLLRETHGADPTSNLFLAPLSASMALGMTLNGASGNTYQEMRETLGFGTLSLEGINQGYRDLMDLLTELDPRVEMGVANSIWYREGFSVRGDFLDRMERYFDGLIRALDFSDPEAPGVINGWVQDQTRGRIKEIVDPPISPSTV